MMNKGWMVSAVAAVALMGSPALAEPLQVIDLDPGSPGRGAALRIAGDVDGDGAAEILMANWYAVEVYPVTAAGPSLQPGTVVDTPEVQAGNIVAGDMNGDGLVDVAWHTTRVLDWPFEHQVEVRYGAASGLPSDADLVLDGAVGLSVADVDGDGLTDVVVGYPEANGTAGQVGVHLGGVAGVAALPDLVIDGVVAGDRLGDFVATGDVNGDGHVDVLARPDDALDEVEVYLGSPVGLMSPPIELVDPQYPYGLPWSGGGLPMAAADLNGDGYDEVVLSSGYYYLGGPGGPSPLSTYVGGGQHSYVKVLGDVDATGRERVSFDSEIFWLDGGVSQWAAVPVGWHCTGGDVDGDGHDDVLCGAGRSDVRLVWGSASGIDATDAVTWPEHPDPYMGKDVVSLGDLDGDGYEDVAAIGGEYLHEEVARVYRGSSQGLETTPAAIWRSSEGLSVGDFDGDGLTDVVMSVWDPDNGHGDFDHQIQVRYGDAAGPGSATVVELGPKNAGGPVVGDGNGDGYDDLAVSMVIKGDVHAGIFHGGPAGLPLFPDTVSPEVDLIPRVWADVNGDGYDDLILTIRERTGGTDWQVRVWVAAGGPTGAGGPVYLLTVPDGAVEIAVGDWNGDGYDDGAFFAQGVAQVVFGGAGGLDAATAMTPAGDWSAFAFDAAPRRDVTGDGLDDLVVDVFREGLRIYAGTTVDFGTASPDERPEELDCAWRGLAFADVDGDGLSEAVWSCGPSLNERGIGFLQVDPPL